MANWRQFRPRPYEASKGIQLGALVCLVDADNQRLMGAAILRLHGDEVVQSLLDGMAADWPCTVISRAVHPTPR